jgi:hypothetical protein
VTHLFAMFASATRSLERPRTCGRLARPMHSQRWDCLTIICPIADCRFLSGFHKHKTTDNSITTMPSPLCPLLLSQVNFPLSSLSSPIVPSRFPSLPSFLSLRSPTYKYMLISIIIYYIQSPICTGHTLVSCQVGII